MARILFLFTLCIQYILIVSLSWAVPKNVIILIGDGLGYEQVRAAGMYANGSEGTLHFEYFPYSGEVTTYSADSSITDSAAAVTAMATGVKVNNGVISIADPGDGSELYTILEYFRDMGKMTGLVSTTYISHATPAAFAAHEPSRDNNADIIADYLDQTRPNILFGGAEFINETGATNAGYNVVVDRSSLNGLATELETRVSGQFGSSHMPYEYDYFTGSDSSYDVLPHLSEMTSAALEILDNDPDGLFLMVESGRIDHAGHDNEIEKNVFETLEFNSTVQAVINWAQGRSDTLILVASDHETGGLSVIQNNGQGVFPAVSWSTTGHTGINVPVYAVGENAHMITGVIDNTYLFSVVTADYSNPVDYYCDYDADAYISDIVSGSCEGTGCEPLGCETDIGDDCDDNSGAVNPGALENCTDGFDNDCDGLIDEDDPDAVNCPFSCTDADSDSYALEGGDCGEVDCNDNDADINPGACDIKNDGIDQDCDGRDRTRGRKCPDNGGKEICDDGIDNDGDGKTDCDDRRDCRRDPAC